MTIFDDTYALYDQTAGARDRNYDASQYASEKIWYLCGIHSPIREKRIASAESEYIQLGKRHADDSSRPWPEGTFQRLRSCGWERLSRGKKLGVDLIEGEEDHRPGFGSALNAKILRRGDF